MTYKNFVFSEDAMTSNSTFITLLADHGSFFYSSPLFGLARV